MDVLGILNDFIKNNKSNEKLAEEFMILFKRGYTLEKIAKTYDLPLDRIREIFKGSQNSNPLFNSSSPIDDVELQKKEDTRQDISFETKNLNIKLSIDIVVDLLNDGISTEEIAFQYNLSTKELNKLLHSEGYIYYSFMDFWTKMNEAELCLHLVEELNQGFSPYYLSGKYVKNNSHRVIFVTKVEHYLKKNQFRYNITKKKWTKFTSEISSIVKELNKGIPMKDVAKGFDIDAADIRLDLKSKNYRFDKLFNIWTQQPRFKLLEELSEDLGLGKITISDLEKRNINITSLEIELKYRGYDYNLTSFNAMETNKGNNLEKIHRKENEKKFNSTPPEKQNDLSINSRANSIEVENVNNEQVSSIRIPFTAEEIGTIKEIIKYWSENKKETGQVEGKTEISIYIENELLTILNKKSELEGVSRSILVTTALKEYLKE